MAGNRIPPRDAWTPEKEARARKILVEKSPHAVDGGQSIGRDPRQIHSREFIEAGIAGHPLLEVIRAKCLDCCAEVADEVRKCTAVCCPNWPYRMGKNPFVKLVLTEEQRAQKAATARANFSGKKIPSS